MRHALVLGDPQALATDKLSLRSLTAWAVALSTQGRRSTVCAGNDGESILGMRYRFVHFSPIHKQLHHGFAQEMSLGDLRSESENKNNETAMDCHGES